MALLLLKMASFSLMHSHDITIGSRCRFSLYIILVVGHVTNEALLV